MTTAIRSSSQGAALLAAANQRGTARVHERASTAAKTTGPYLLPNDLAGALRYLSPEELKRLSEAVIAESTRRAPADEMHRRGFPSSTAARRAEAGLKDEQPTINQGRANAIQGGHQGRGEADGSLSPVRREPIRHPSCPGQQELACSQNALVRGPRLMGAHDAVHEKPTVAPIH